MNERLEIEIARYSGRISQDKAKNQPFAILDKCARYFYKLALQDVREEIERWNCPEHGHLIEHYLDFIDNLTK